MRFILSLIVINLTACAQLAGPSTTQPLQPNQALLIAPEAIDIMHIDGEQHQYLGRRGELRLPLSAGKHQIEVRYQELFNQGSDQQELVTSDNKSYQFELQPGQEYQIQVPPINGLESARAFAQKPEFVIKAQDKTLALQPVLPFKTSPVPAAAADATDSEPLKQLKYWWQQATPAEQEAFFRWKSR